MTDALIKELKDFPPVSPLSGSTLKLVAIITMTIDHFAAGIIYFMLVTWRFPEDIGFERLYQIYLVLRGIGRTAFPIYCFLLIEGLLHTHSRIRYLINLLLFAVLSELPFDLIATDTLTDPMSLDIPKLIYDNRPEIYEHQNVFLTLAIGLAACWIIEEFRRRYGVRPITFLVAVPATAGAFYLAEATNTDYGGIGVLVIMCFYFLHSIRLAALGCAFFVLSRLYLEVWAFPAFILILFYSGKRGFIGNSPARKYFFYIYYPAHLFLFFLMRTWILGMY